MIYSEDFVHWLSDKTGKAYYNGSKTEIICYCPFCESGRLKKHGHMYVDVNEPVFYCHKCGETGNIVRLISLLGGKFEQFVDKSVLERSASHSYTRKDLSTVVKTFATKESSNQYTENFEIKQEYLKKRLGDFDLSKIPGLIFSIKSFLRENNIPDSEDPMMLNLVNILETSYVGFLSSRGKNIIFRNCTGDSPYRYFKYSLDNSISFFHDFYGIRTSIMSKDTPTVVLCEGVFDLLVGLLSDELSELRKKSLFWAAGLGKPSFGKTLISTMDFCKCVRVNLVILSDADAPWYFYVPIKDMPFVNRLDVYWNKRGKDFGCKPIEVFKREIRPRMRRRIYVTPHS